MSVPEDPRRGAVPSFSARLATMTRAAAVSHGYSLSILGAFVLTLALRGFPHALSLCLFVVGALVGASAPMLAGAAPSREDETSSVLSLTPILAPLVVAPSAAGVAAVIPAEWLAFLVAGFIASAGCVVLLKMTDPWRRGASATDEPIHPRDTPPHTRRSD